jgi:lactoylglutathione lyase
MIQFTYTILYVDNVEETCSFYEKAFGFERKFITPENDYAELITGQTTLSFASTELASSNLSKGFIKSESGQKPFGIELGFVTENVEESVSKAIENGASLVEAAKQKPWGQTVAYIQDPNGFLIELCSAMV